MRFFLLFLAFLPTLMDVTLAEDNNYDQFLPSDEPNESEWTMGNLASATNLDLIDTGSFEDPSVSYNQELPQYPAGTGMGCSSEEVQPLNRLRPRGVDDYCQSNLGPQERPVIIPNLSTLDLEALCPNKFIESALQLVCASKNPENIRSSLFTGITLFECEAGVFPVFSEFFVASNSASYDDDKS